MVLINRVKYSCERCIRGHRCSLCQLKKSKGQKVACTHIVNGRFKMDEKPPLSPTSKQGTAPYAYSANVNSFPAAAGSADGINGKPQEGYSYLGEFTMEEQLPEEVSPDRLEMMKSDPGIVVELPDGTMISGSPQQQQQLADMHSQKSQPVQPPPLPLQTTSTPGMVLPHMARPYGYGYPSKVPMESDVGGSSSSSASASSSRSNSSSTSGYAPPPLTPSQMFGVPYGMGTHPYIMPPGPSAGINSSMSSVANNPRFDEHALSNSMPHKFNHLNIVTHPPPAPEELYSAPPPQHAVPPPPILQGPYTAALYNDTLGNNAASAAINLHGTTNYVPGMVPRPTQTPPVPVLPYLYRNRNGSASSHASSTEHAPQSVANELYSTNQELASSLPGIDKISAPMQPEALRQSIKEPEFTADSIAQLSNLY